MYRGSQTGTPAGKLTQCSIACLFYWNVFSKAMHSSLWTQILPLLLSDTSPAHSSLLTPRGLKAMEFTYYLSFQLLLKLFKTFLNSRKHTFLHLPCSMRVGKWDTGWWGTVCESRQCPVKLLPLLSFNTGPKLLENTNATCWTAVVALTQSLPDTKTVQSSPHLPLLPGSC